jgi:hypothetical protein
MEDSMDHGLSRCASGIYLVDEEERARLLGGGALPADVRLAVLDGAAAASRTGFFAEAARALSLPAYFGHNWDALYDCLTDPSWLPGSGCVILYDGFGGLARAEPEQWQSGLTVLHEACAFWRPLDRRLVVLLSGPGGLAPGVERLPAGCLPDAD